MKLKGLTFVLNEDCNFRCSYCAQRKTGARLAERDARRFLLFFCPASPGMTA
jgi:molybdenum cofactor biosynthesis enzyme MoaA